MVEAVIKILQFEVDNGEGQIRDISGSASNSFAIRDIAAAKNNSYRQTHLPAVQNPVPKNSPQAWPTEDPNDWSDSPTNQPLLLYRYRYSFGRDKVEIFQQPIRGITSTNPIGTDGQRWGNMDDVSGVLIYEDLYAKDSSGTIGSFNVQGLGRVSQKLYAKSSTFTSVRHLGSFEGETTLEQFPFLITALPEPYSTKNPVDSDVFIRLSNYTNTIVSGTITLSLNGVEQSNLVIEEFFSGLGGFDITWNNQSLFDYDAEVLVRWEFRDSAIPANRFVVSYPFYTVQDLAGPRVSNILPLDQAESVPINTSIQFDVEDFENDVDINSLVLYVNNTLIVSGENGTITTERLGNEKGYTVRFVPDTSFLYGDLIPVAIFINDTSENSNQTFFTFSFTTEESLAPRLINITPSPCTIQVPTGADISVDIIDGGHGLNKNTIVFTVDEVEQGNSILLIPIVHRDE